jgi:hypothetical protein
MKSVKILFISYLFIFLPLSIFSDSYNKVVIISSDKKPVSIFKTFTRKKDTFGINFQNEITKINSLTYAKCISSANYGFEGDPVAYEIETDDKIKGWVSLDKIWFPAQVINVKQDDVLNIREKQSSDSNILDKVLNNDIIFINADDLVGTLGYKGYDPTDWRYVCTKNQIIGYAKFYYLKLFEINVKRY